MLYIRVVEVNNSLNIHEVCIHLSVSKESKLKLSSSLRIARLSFQHKNKMLYASDCCDTSWLHEFSLSSTKKMLYASDCCDTSWLREFVLYLARLILINLEILKQIYTYREKYMLKFSVHRNARTCVVK
jgi:hypothetical protein